MPVLKRTEIQPAEIKPGVERTIIYTKNLMTAVIDFKNGPWAEPDPFHHHVHEQVTYIAEGEVLFLCEGEAPQHLKAGDMFAVGSGKPHTIQLLSKSARLIDSFNPVREDFLK